VLTGNGKAFSAGGDFTYLDELSRDPGLRRRDLGPRPSDRHRHGGVPRAHRGRRERTAVGLGCSLVALSDIVFMAESTHLADPHVLMGLVAADGGPVTWPQMSLVGFMQAGSTTVYAGSWRHPATEHGFLTRATTPSWAGPSKRAAST
jgi:enoyl-CoA hydratase/carnithine racemase